MRQEVSYSKSFTYYTKSYRSENSMLKDNLEFESTNKNNIDLLEAIFQGDVKKAREAIERGAKVNEANNEDGYSALDVAVIQNNPAIIDLLAENGAFLCDHNPKDHLYGHPLLVAIRLNNKDVAKAYLSRTPDIENQPWFKNIHDKDYTDRIKELRAELVSNKSTETSDLSRLLYRLKDEGIILAAGVLPFVVSGVLFEHSCCTLAFTAWASLGTVTLSSMREPHMSFSCYDIVQGVKMMWSEGVMDTIAKIYNTPRYIPLSCSEYEYRFESAGNTGHSRE